MSDSNDLPAGLSMENFENVMAGIDVQEDLQEDFDVIDEVGGDSDEEREKDRTRENRSRDKDRRSRTHSIGSYRERARISRNRSRSPRRYNRSRSRERVRNRSPLKRRSPGGAAAFLKEIGREFGDFEGLKDVQKKVQTHSIMEERDKIRKDNPPRQNNRNKYQNKQQQPNQYQNINNGMQMQNQMNPMMMMNPMCNPQMMVMAQMPYQGGFIDNICPPGVDPGITCNMQQPQFIPQQPMVQVPAPIMTGTQVISDPLTFRNASPPKNPEIDLSNISARLLSQNKMHLSEYLETQKTRAPPKLIEARPLKERVLAKCKAAVHRLEHAAKDIQFERNFLHVPPAFPSDMTDVVGASPVLPSKNNPVFRFSTKQLNAIPKCRPYPLITRNIDPLIRQLGIDESVISRRLESSNITQDREEEISSQRSSQHSNNVGVAQNQTLGILQPRVPMRDTGSQTPHFACLKCENRFENLMNTQTQTTVIEKLSKPTQTRETEFELAKIRFKKWQKEQERNASNFRRDYSENFSDDEDGSRRRSPPVVQRSAIGPPGFRELKTTLSNASTSSKSTQNSNYDNETTRRLYSNFNKYQGSHF